MSDPSGKILVVEDDADIRRFVRLALVQDGYAVVEADTLQRGLIEAGTRQPDLIVLDLGLPDGDGVDFIKDLRGWSQVPVLVLSARTTETDKIEALDAGADDYLVKPFGARELTARARAHLRRRTMGAAPVQSTLVFGEVTLDMARRTVTRGHESIHLTPIEYRLLTYLAAHPDCVLTHRQVLRSVWGPSHAEDAHYVRVYMGNLRKKLEVDPTQPRHLLTETGIGYRFVP